MQDSEKDMPIFRLPLRQKKKPVKFQRILLNCRRSCEDRVHTPYTFGIKAVKKRKSKCEKVTNKIRILRKPYAYLQIILKAHDVVMFEKDQP